MSIRKIGIQDISEDLLRLYIDGFRFHYNERPDVFLYKDDDELKEELIYKVSNYNVIVFEKNKRILGFISYKVKDRISKVLWINELVVDENNRNLGIGKSLLEKVGEIAKEENCIRIEFYCWSFNKNAMEIYKHLGYSEQKVVLEMEL